MVQQVASTLQLSSKRWRRFSSRAQLLQMMPTKAKSTPVRQQTLPLAMLRRTE